MMLGSALSNQVGAATGALAFPVLGPAGVVAVRQWVAGIVLLAVGRPRLRSFTWRAVVAGAARWRLVFGTMNLSLYTAIDRVGLGLAVTLEFLGPLAVALAARAPGDRPARARWSPAPPWWCWPDRGRAPTTSASALACWPRPAGPATSCSTAPSAAGCPACRARPPRPGLRVLYLPVGLVVFVQHPPTAAALGCAVAAGILSSAVPFLADLLALRRVPARFFGVFMSVNPVLAALIGMIILQQSLPAVAWLAIAAIVAANAAAAAIRRAR